jgi:hypothetical protein
LLLHALQLYVQLLQMSDPSPSRRRLASESRRVPQVLQRKQSICHRLPAVDSCQQVYSRCMSWWRSLGGCSFLFRGQSQNIRRKGTYLIRMLFLPRVSIHNAPVSLKTPILYYTVGSPYGLCFHSPPRSLCMGRPLRPDPW